jgi:hypothetical protein
MFERYLDIDRLWTISNTVMQIRQLLDAAYEGSWDITHPDFRMLTIQQQPHHAFKFL